MPRLSVNGGHLYVRVLGQGAPLVALHGFTGDHTTWQPFATAAKEEFNLLLPDLLGHGRSSAPAQPERYRMEQCIEDLLGVLDSLGIQEAAWMGYSMGGRIALGVALTAPERCTALVLEGASPGLADPRERAQRVASDEVLARLLEQEGITKFVDVWESQPLFSSQRHRLSEVQQARLRRQRLRNTPVGLAASLRGIGTGSQPALHGQLGRLCMPVLLAVGEDDVKYRAIAKEMGAALTNSRVAVIPEAGHTAHLEQPQRFNAVVLDFLRQHAMEQGTALHRDHPSKPAAVPLKGGHVQGHAQAGALGRRKEAAGGW